MSPTQLLPRAASALSIPSVSVTSAIADFPHAVEIAGSLGSLALTVWVAAEWATTFAARQRAERRLLRRVGRNDAR